MSEIAELSYLARSLKPLWGGHLQRGEPVSDLQMRSWIARGIIVAVEEAGVKGYRLTAKGYAAIDEKRLKHEEAVLAEAYAIRARRAAEAKEKP